MMLTRILLRLLPRAFRERFGDEILAQVAREHERAHANGPLAALWSTMATGADLVRTAVAERVHPTWVSAPLPSREDSPVTWSFSEWGRDLRHAVHSLKRSPGFVAVAVVTLGLAIGVNAAMFSVVDTVLLRPLPFAHQDRLVYIAASAPGSDFPDEFGMTAEFYALFHEQSKLLENVAAYNAFTSTLRAGDRVERVAMSQPTNSLFPTLGATPILGRLPGRDDGERAAVISYALWQSWFGGDSAVIGRAYDISGARRTVIGVMGPAFHFPDDKVLLWISNEISADSITPGRFGLRLVGRLRAGATTDALAKELTALSKQAPERFGGSAAYARLIQQLRAVVRPLEKELLGPVARPLWVLLASVGLVLLIACANVANLFAVRAEGRQRDLAVRRAIGAARGQLIRLQLSEALVVATGAGGVALFIAFAGLPTFVHAAPEGIPRIGTVHIDAATLLFTLVAAVASALACGIVPAVRASAPDLARLREAGRAVTRGRRWARDGLVIAQTALALVLLIGSGLLLRSITALRHVDPGYTTKDIFTFQFAPRQAALRDGPSFARFDLDFVDRLEALPGVESAGIVDNLPLDEGLAGSHFVTAEKSDDEGTMLSYTSADGDYFHTMGIALLRGRPLTRAENIAWSGNVVISKSAADLLWPGQDPIGRRFHRRGDSIWLTVVGEVADVMQYGFRDTPQAMLYLPLVGPTPTSWARASPAYVVRTPRAEQIAPEVRALVRQVAPEAPMYRVYTMAELAARSMVELSFTTLTLGILSTLALILGAVGLYGVLSYLVAQRTREIGVRMALGARADQVRRMVVVQGAQLVAGGVVIGVVVAVASTRILGSLLFGVRALDATTFLAMSGSMVVIGLLASYLPARRASSVDPIESLRGE